MTEYEGIERRKENRETQEMHDTLIRHGMKLEAVCKKIDGIDITVKEMVKTLIQDRKDCWETCNGQLKIVEGTANDAKSSIKAIKAVGSAVAFGLTLLAGWAKIGGGR